MRKYRWRHSCVIYLSGGGLVQAKNIILTLAVAAMLSACGQQTMRPSKSPVISKTEPLQAQTALPKVIVKTMGQDTAQDKLDTALIDNETMSEANEDSTDSLSAVESDVTSTQDAKPSGDDVINNIIWDIQARETKRAEVPEAVIPEGLDPSLAEDALEAAFALLSQRNQSQIPSADFVLPEKDEGVSRVALLVPLTGKRRALGEELRKGAEMALFAVATQNTELLVFDTAGGPLGMDAANQAVAADVDIIIGPLFTEAAIPARDIARRHNIPMLFLSNNTDIGQQGSWILGYAPEQQLDVALAHAIALGQEKIAILAQNTPFGQKLKDHAENRLTQFGIKPEEVQTLSADILNDEELLKDAIKLFARYQPPDDDEEYVAEPEPPFQGVVFAGDAAFALRTAPVLAYYDIAADTVTYLGNSQWNQRQIHSEPSLQGGIYAIRPTTNDQKFNNKWAAIWTERPGLLGRLSFDAMAMVTVLARDANVDWQNSLISNAGFAGFSGAFRLLPDGGNVRAFELRQINNGTTDLLMAAPSKI